jgi:hypothetical protein
LTQRSFVPASVILQELQDRPPTGPVTLQRLMERLGQQSFGIFILLLAIVATIPGIAFLAGLLLLITALQMMLGRSELKFPGWLSNRELPTRHVGTVMRRAIPILAYLERGIYPRLASPTEATRRVVGVIVFVLTVRLLTAPFPFSNLLPAILIAFISLTYLEQDGLLLIVAVVVGCLVLVAEFGAIWHLIHDAKWIQGLV